MNYIGIDLGGTVLKVIAYINSKKEMFKKYDSCVEAGRDEFVENLIKIIRGIMITFSLEPSETFIGIGTPGIWSIDGKMVTGNCGNIPWLIDDPIIEEIERMTGVTMFGGNDAKLQLLAEITVGAGQGCRAVTFLGMGTGIGGGIARDGKICLGFNGQGGELGHIIINSDFQYSCTTGHRGCAESIIGTVGIARIFRECCSLIDDMSPKTIDLYVSNENTRIVKEVFELMNESDGAARRAVSVVGSNLALLIYNIIRTNPCDRVVIGGQISRDLEKMLDSIWSTLKYNFSEEEIRELTIVKSEFPADGGAIGAAKLAELMCNGENPFVYS